MAISRNFKTGPLSPRQEAAGFFCKKKFTNRSSVSAARGLGGGGCCPPLGRQGPPLYKPSTPIHSSFEPKNSTKNPEKKRGGEEKGSGEALPDCALVICRLVHLVYVFFHWYCRII